MATTNCLNCGEDVSGKFCPECGQPTRDPRGSLIALAGDFFSEFFSLDGKQFRTIGALLRPGLLTEHFSAGRRASFVSPIRLYLVLSLLFFLVVGIPSPNTEGMNVYIGDEVIGRDEPLANARGRIQLLDLEDSSWIRTVAPSVEAKLEDLKTRPVQEVVDKYFAGLERTIPTALIVFVPFLAFALKLLYLRSGTLYVDHLVFALHSQGFLFLMLVACRVANVLGLTALIPGVLTYVAAFVLVFPVYMFLALRRFYKQSWWLSALKAMALAFLYFTLIQPVLGLTIFLVVWRL